MPASTLYDSVAPVPPYYVAHVVHSLDVGGLENGVINIVNDKCLEFRHVIISMTPNNSWATRLGPHVPIYSLDKRLGQDLGTFFQLVKLLRRLRPTIVHTRNWATFDAIPAGKLAGVPIIIHGEHGRDITDPEGTIRRRNLLRRWFAPLVDRMIVVSQDLREWLVQRVGIRPEKVKTIYNGVDIDRFLPRDKIAARHALGVKRAAIVIGTVGRLDPVKDQASLVHAFATVAVPYPDALLVIVGSGPCREKLHALIANLGLAERVFLLGERQDIPEVLNAINVFVLPSIAEGISNTILEAMATGLPIVATDVGGNKELIQQAVTGTLVAPRNPDVLARAIMAYLQDQDKRQLHGRMSRERAIESFSLEKMRSQYTEMYGNLVAQNKSM